MKWKDVSDAVSWKLENILKRSAQIVTFNIIMDYLWYSPYETCTVSTELDNFHQNNW